MSKICKELLSCPKNTAGPYQMCKAPYECREKISNRPLCIGEGQLQRVGLEISRGRQALGSRPDLHYHKVANKKVHLHGRRFYMCYGWRYVQNDGWKYLLCQDVHSSNTNEKKSPWKKGQVGSSFLLGRVAGAQVSNLAEIVQIWK